MKRFFKTLLVLLLVLMPVTFANAKKTTTTTAAAPASDKMNLYVFYGNGCPHCEELEQFIATSLKKDSRVKDLINVIYYETWYDETNQMLVSAVGQALNVEVKGVPFFVIGDQYFSGYGSQMNEEIVSTIQKVQESGKYTDVVAAVSASTKITGNESNPEAGIATEDDKKDDSKKNDTIGIIILGVTVVIILAIIFTKHSDDAEEDEEDEKAEEKEEVEKVEKKEEPKTTKKTTSTKKKATNKK